LKGKVLYNVKEKQNNFQERLKAANSIPF